MITFVHAGENEKRNMLAGLRWSGDVVQQQRQEEEEEEQQLKEDAAPIRYRSEEGDGHAVKTDGGASYRASALRRAAAEAQETGKSLEEVVVERWGTLEELTRGDPDFLKKALSRGEVPGRRVEKRRDRRHIRADPPVSAAKRSADAVMLKNYARKLENAIDDAVGTNGKATKKGRRETSRDDTDEQPQWVGLAARQTLGKGKDATFSDGWRRTTSYA